MHNSPTVSIVIVNLDGKEHLKRCLASLTKLSYPKDKIEIIVVDNGSKDGSVEFIKENFGFVKLITNSRNEGFAKPSNDGARAATGEMVAFLNNDMRVDKNWLTALVNSLSDSEAQCAGSLILSWDGRLIDFAGGSINYSGRGYQHNFKKPLHEMGEEIAHDTELLFACGGAMLMPRRIFLEAGGFDEDYFAYFEDVDLGWRLHVLGYKIVLSVNSRVQHRHNNTSKTITRERIQYLFERNKLYTIYKNYGDDLFNKIFYSTLLLDVREAYLQSRIDGENYKIQNSLEYNDDPVRVAPFGALKLAAINEFAGKIAVMSEKRRFIQSNRKTPDAEIMKFIDNPFITFGKDTAEFINSEFDFVKSVGIDKAIGADYKTRIVVICNDGADGEKVKKYLELLNYLDSTGLFSIAFVCGKSKCAVPEGVKLFSYTPDKPRIIINAALEANTLIIPPDVLRDIPGLKDIARKKYVVMDISSENAVTTENINGAAGASLPEEYLRLADFFICADGAQEDGLKAVLENIQGFCRALDNRVTAWQQDAGTDSGGTMKQVADFCVKPSYATPRDDRGGILELSEVADIENRPVSDGNSVFERLSNIEAQQVRLEKMIRDNIRISKGVDDEVRDVLGWTTLMNNRFDKLKYRLSKVRLIGRFFN